MATGASRLSANMQALSYALGLAKDSSDALEVSASKGQTPGPMRARRQSEERASPSDQSLELTPGKPLRNFGRRLAWEAGIPLPYNMRQSQEAAEQAQIDYENENSYVSSMATTVDQQMAENATNAADPAEARVYQHLQQQGADAAHAFFADGASDAQRKAALGQIVKVQDAGNQYLNADVNEKLKATRQFLGGELASSRSGLVEIDNSTNTRIMDTEAALAKLDNAKPGSAEEQAILRAMLASSAQYTSDAAQALKGAGAIAGSIPSGWGQAIGAGAQAIGGFLANQDRKLDRNVVTKMILEQNKTLDDMTTDLRGGVQEQHEKVAEDAKRYGIPSESWSAPRIHIRTPHTDAYRDMYFPQGAGLEPNPEGPAPSTNPEHVATDEQGNPTVTIPRQYQDESDGDYAQRSQAAREADARIQQHRDEVAQREQRQRRPTR